MCVPGMWSAVEYLSRRPMLILRFHECVWSAVECQPRCQKRDLHHPPANNRKNVPQKSLLSLSWNIHHNLRSLSTSRFTLRGSRFCTFPQFFTFAFSGILFVRGRFGQHVKIVEIKLATSTYQQRQIYFNYVLYKTGGHTF